MQGEFVCIGAGAPLEIHSGARHSEFGTRPNYLITRSWVIRTRGWYVLYTLEKGLTRRWVHLFFPLLPTFPNQSVPPLQYPVVKLGSYLASLVMAFTARCTFARATLRQLSLLNPSWHTFDLLNTSNLSEMCYTGERGVFVVLQTTYGYARLCKVSIPIPVFCIPTWRVCSRPQQSQTRVSVAWKIPRHLGCNEMPPRRCIRIYFLSRIIVDFMIREANGEKHFDQTLFGFTNWPGPIEMLFAVRLTNHEIYIDREFILLFISILYHFRWV